MRQGLHRIGTPALALLALVVAWIIWAAVCAGAAGNGLSPGSPYVVAPTVLALGVGLGHAVAGPGGRQVLMLALPLATGALLLGVLVSSGSGSAPLGYANANAALAVQLIGLSGLALLSAAGRSRTIILLVALGACAAVFANGSRAGLIAALPLTLVVVLMAWRPVRRRSWLGIAAISSLALTSTAAAIIVGLARREDWPPWAITAFDPARHSLWHDAWQLWSTHPVFGVGPGNFERLSALGNDPDTAAAHSSVLQVGAETGTVGVVLLGLTVLAGLVWAGRGRPAYGVVGVAAWTALFIHALVDHLLDFPAVVLAGGLVVGWAGASRARSEELDVPHREGPLAHGRG